MRLRKISNCWLWARYKKFKCGGYIASRRTRVVIFNRWQGWWNHYFWSEDLVTWYSYKSKTDEYFMEKWFGIPAILFDGEVVKGDDV